MTQYLNTDLEIESRDDLTPIIEAFGDDVICLHHGPVRGHNFASFEVVGSSGDSPSAEDCIRWFYALVQGLSPSARSTWESCSRRTFDIGFEGGLNGENCQQILQYEVVSLLAAMRADLVITVYPPSELAT
jgi:hypothetical protein